MAVVVVENPFQRTSKFRALLGAGGTGRELCSGNRAVCGFSGVEPGPVWISISMPISIYLSLSLYIHTPIYVDISIYIYKDQNLYENLCLYV